MGMRPQALKTSWTAANCISSKRLAPFLKELVPVLERHGHLKLTEETRSMLFSISPATIDRILKPLRSNEYSISTTRTGKLLKHQIPIRTFADWNEQRPGFFEVDLVAHCGWSMEGSFLYTMVLTDVATGWIECTALPHRTGDAVIHGLEKASRLIPFPILGIDTDNGCEFINNDLVDYCRDKEITFTRGRAYKKNDQCYVEQKNGVIVRQIVGYDRFEGLSAYKKLAELYSAVRIYVNFFQPSMKLKEKCRIGSKIKKTYYPARTPLQRVTDAINIQYKNFDTLDPVRLLKQMQLLQDALWKHAVVKSPDLADDINTTISNPSTAQTIGCNLSKSGSKGGKNDHYEDLVLNHKIIKKRRYKKAKRTKIKRLWRTRKDPFENVWEKICLWLENNPERTSTSILAELQMSYPNQYTTSQLRTLQRRMKIWRKNTITEYDGSLLNHDSLIIGDFEFDESHAVLVDTSKNLSEFRLPQAAEKFYKNFKNDNSTGKIIREQKSK